MKSKPKSWNGRACSTKLMLGHAADKHLVVSEAVVVVEEKEEEEEEEEEVVVVVEEKEEREQVQVRDRRVEYVVAIAFMSETTAENGRAGAASAKYDAS
jgi:hypothetical protein